jgi:hypothetical protein
MKKLLAIMALSLCGNAIADNFEKTQHNFRLRHNDYGLELREEIKSNKDHMQFSYFGINKAEIRFRYVDNLESKEFRPQISYMVIDNDNFFFRPRLDYRYFLGDNPDYFSFRSTVGGRYQMNQNYRLWTEINPIWDFGQSKDNDTTLDKAQFRFGFDYIANNLQFSPFVQYETDGKINHTDTFLGTTTTLNY